MAVERDIKQNSNLKGNLSLAKERGDFIFRIYFGYIKILETPLASSALYSLFIVTINSLISQVRPAGIKKFIKICSLREYRQENKHTDKHTPKLNPPGEPYVGVPPHD